MVSVNVCFCLCVDSVFPFLFLYIVCFLISHTLIISAWPSVIGVDVETAPPTSLSFPLSCPLLCFCVKHNQITMKDLTFSL